MAAAENQKFSTETDLFIAGMVVCLTTCHNEKIQGEVVAFDAGSKVLIMKSTASSGRPECNDIQFVNMRFVSNVELVKPSSISSVPLSNINYNKLTARMKASVDDKMKRLDYIGIGVTQKAQKLAEVIAKTIPEVRWNGDKIIVLNEVTISPPYGVDDCQAKDSQIYQNGQSLSHVRKIVRKFHDDYKERGSTPSSSSSSSPHTVA